MTLETENVSGLKEQKRKSKKGKAKGDKNKTEESNFEEADDRLLLDYQQQIVQEEARTLKNTKAEDERTVYQNVSLNNDVGKKKKKKLKSAPADSDIG